MGRGTSAGGLGRPPARLEGVELEAGNTAHWGVHRTIQSTSVFGANPLLSYVPKSRPRFLEVVVVDGAEDAEPVHKQELALSSVFVFWERVTAVDDSMACHNIGRTYVGSWILSNYPRSDLAHVVDPPEYGPE